MNLTGGWINPEVATARLPVGAQDDGDVPYRHSVLARFPLPSQLPFPPLMNRAARCIFDGSQCHTISSRLLHRDSQA